MVKTFFRDFGLYWRDLSCSCCRFSSCHGALSHWEYPREDGYTLVMTYSPICRWAVILNWCSGTQSELLNIPHTIRAPPSWTAWQDGSILLCFLHQYLTQSSECCSRYCSASTSRIDVLWVQCVVLHTLFVTIAYLSYCCHIKPLWQSPSDLCSLFLKTLVKVVTAMLAM